MKDLWSSGNTCYHPFYPRSSLFDPYSDNEEEELEYGRGGRKESDDLMLQLDSIIPGVLEPFGKSE